MKNKKCRLKKQAFCHICKKNLMESKMKTIAKSEIIVITQANIGAQHIVSATWDTKHQKKFLCLIKVLIMTIIL